MSDAVDTEFVGKRRRPEQRLVDEQLAEELIAQAQEQGVDLLGEGGLLQQMTKAVLERALAEELTDHLGYEQGDPAGRAAAAQLLALRGCISRSISVAARCCSL